MWPTLRRLGLRARINGAHSSSRFDRTPAALLWAFAMYAQGRSIISFTEVGNDKRLVVLRRLPGWKVVHVNQGHGKDECAIAYREKRWRLISRNTYPLTKSPVPFLDVVEMLEALFEHFRTGQTVMWLSWHSPARVENGDHWGTRSPADVKAYKELLERLPKRLAVHQANPDIDHVVAAADANLNLRRARWSTLLNSTFAKGGLTSVWAGRLPRLGSHKNTERLIDGIWTDAQVTASGVSKLDRSSDHKMIWFRGVLKRIGNVTRWKAIVADRHRRWGIDE